jgi:hypothetical protein
MARSIDLMVEMFEFAIETQLVAKGSTQFRHHQHAAEELVTAARLPGRETRMPYAQLRGSGVRAAALLAVVLLAGCKQELYSGLDERDANQIVAVLLDHGLAAERRRQKAGDMAVYVE